MKRLWAGWRMPYLTGGAGQPKGCLFCRLAKLKPADENLILDRSEASLVVLNAFPYNTGHVMVAPLRHCASPAGLTAAERAAVWEHLARCEKAIRKAYRPQGLNMGLNIGRVAGAGVVGHVHFHIVPRWNGDTNFMPVVADTKVLPESIDSSYARLKAALAAGAAGRRRGR